MAKGRITKRAVDAAKPCERDTYLWDSDLSGFGMKVTPTGGMPDDYDRLVRRGDPAEGAFMVFYMAGRKICAVNAVNMGKEMRIAERLMLQAVEVDDADLADTDLRLRNLTKR